MELAEIGPLRLCNLAMVKGLLKLSFWNRWSCLLRCRLGEWIHRHRKGTDLEQVEEKGLEKALEKVLDQGLEEMETEKERDLAVELAPVMAQDPREKAKVLVKE